MSIPTEHFNIIDPWEKNLKKLEQEVGRACLSCPMCQGICPVDFCVYDERCYYSGKIRVAMEICKTMREKFNEARSRI
ncbi:hypothetical protein FACS1894167_12290 [Synergistales bacterium]|nr:hypothetical protein FACS1894167_12290 [Synergistales bacterium]